MSSVASSPISIHESRLNKDEDVPLRRITTSGKENEYVHIGDHKYLRSELEYAFGGTFTTGPGVRPHLKLGNASPMALLAFSVTTVTLSLINSGARGVENHAVMLGSALFYGGAVQILAGFWELVLENTFGGTVFASYGGFWMSFSVLTMGGFNVENSYSTTKEYNNAVGIFMLVWAIISSMFMLCTIRSTVPMFGLLLTTTLSDACVAASYFAKTIGSEAAGGRCERAGGILGCMAGFLALYNAMAGLLSKENSYIVIKPWYMPGAIRPDASNKAKEA